MGLMNVLVADLNSTDSAEGRGKGQVVIGPHSKVIVKFLAVMLKHSYIGKFEIIDDRRARKIIVNLPSRLNSYGVMAPDLIYCSEV